jgi:hypothetical protein
MNAQTKQYLIIAVIAVAIYFFFIRKKPLKTGLFITAGKNVNNASVHPTIATNTVAVKQTQPSDLSNIANIFGAASNVFDDVFGSDSDSNNDSSNIYAYPQSTSQSVTDLSDSTGNSITSQAIE